MESIIKKLGKASITVEKDYHSSEKEYNKLTIVEEQGAFKTYLSRKPVPVGIELTNREYWIPFSGVLESITFDYLKFKKDYASGKAIEDNAIITRHILNRNIERIKIALKAISEEEIDDNAIIERTIKDRNVTSNKIAKENILTEHLAKKSIITNILTDYAVTAIKLADNSVTTRSIVNENVTQEKLSIDIQSLISNLSKTATFSGIATPTTNPGIPTAKTFYIANDKGIYNYFNNIEIIDDEVAILYFDTTWHKKTTGIAPKETLIKLKEKVDSLALGTFYGFFPDSSSLPIDITTSGYAYVGLDTPYKIWNFNGESWSDSGTVIDMNDADEEDITRNIDGKLQFKDKEYGDGMGHVILRKNKSFAEQVTKENTIYEIRYNFDLNGEEIIIPENCVLKFNGGSLSNGTIKGNSTNIISDYLIFKNVNVIGSWSTIGESKWFVQSSPYTIRQDEVFIDKLDVSDDFQTFLNSSFRKIHICKGFYYITKPLIISNSIEINMDGGSSCNYLLKREMDCIDKTFIFSNKNITLLQFTANDTNVKNIILNGGNLDVSLAYSEKSLYDTHCIEIDIRNRRKYWGIYINTTINGTYNDLKPSQGTAIKFIDDGRGGYATMVNLNCIIRRFDLAYDIKSSNSSWITNVNLYGECNYCNRVLDTTADTVSKVDVQTQAVFTKENVKDYPLFKSSSTLVIGGHLWDVGTKQGDKTTNYYVAEIIGNESNDRNRTILFIDSMKYYEDSFIKDNRIIGDFYIPSPFNYGDKIHFYPSLLFNAFEGYNFIKDNAYTYRLLNNVTASVDVKNKNGMFLNERGTTFNIQNADQEKVDLEITFDLTNENIQVGCVTLLYMSYANSKRFDSCNIKINTEKYGTRELTYYDSIDNYTRTKNIVSWSDITNNATSIVITFKNVSSELMIQKIIVNKIRSIYFNYMPSFLPISGGTVYGKADFRDLYLKDYKITADSRGIIINDTYDAMGNPINTLKYGTTAQRPTGVNEGYQYYDTTLKKYIIWNGTEWTNIDGTSLE